MGVFVDITGQKFNRLTVLKRVFNESKGHARWECLCECGNTTILNGTIIKNGIVKSCGCLRSDTTTAIKTKHGKAKTKEHVAWINMRARCYNPKRCDYPRYGGRGMRVCDTWNSDFVNFLNDMGLAPSEHYSIDRIDVNGDYEPANCKWSTEHEQSINRRTFKNNSTGQTGVIKNRNGKFEARINVNNKRIQLGVFSKIEEAIRVRKEAEQKYWGKSS